MGVISEVESTQPLWYRILLHAKCRGSVLSGCS